MTFEELPQGFKDWKSQYACDDPSSPGYNIRDLYAAFTTGLQSSTPYTEGYAKGYSDGVEQQHSQLRLLAEAVLVAHSDYCDYCPYTMSEPEWKAAGCNDGQGCQCHACKVAREVMGCKPTQ